MKPTEEEIKERAEAWAKALEANKRKAFEIMKDDRGGRCCLRVAEDLAVAQGVPLDFMAENNTHPIVGDWFGWRSDCVINPTLKTPRGDHAAVILNDGGPLSAWTKGLSHKKIAECVRKTFCGDTSPWSFK